MIMVIPKMYSKILLHNCSKKCTFMDVKAVCSLVHLLVELLVMFKTCHITYKSKPRILNEVIVFSIDTNNLMGEWNFKFQDTTAVIKPPQFTLTLKIKSVQVFKKKRLCCNIPDPDHKAKHGVTGDFLPLIYLSKKHQKSTHGVLPGCS